MAMIAGARRGRARAGGLPKRNTPMIDIRKLKELVRLMVDNDLSELDLKDQEETVTIKRGSAGAPMMSVLPLAPAANRPTPVESNGTDHLASQPSAQEDTAGLVAITSPMVGTFYSAPNPDSGPFVSAGSPVTPDTVVCLIEAMKVFNEIKAEVSGTVARVLVQNGSAVEFGQTLFLVKPS
jgi:acetyl-CoA carboxylase biotin carboxyl carrier protein